MRYDAVILAGGRATRLGGTPKPGIVVGGASLLDHALAATAEAESTAVVGPRDAVAQPRCSLVVTREDPPFGGPVAGLDAGLRALDRPGAPPWVLLLAVDVPAAATAVPALCAALSDEPDADGAHLVRADRAQWLVGIYRRAALGAALRAVDPHGAAVRRLVASMRLITVPDETGTSDDVDTWEDVNRLTARHAVGHTEEGER